MAVAGCGLHLRRHVGVDMIGDTGVVDERPADAGSGEQIARPDDPADCVGRSPKVDRLEKIPILDWLPRVRISRR